MGAVAGAASPTAADDNLAMAEITVRLVRCLLDGYDVVVGGVDDDGGSPYGEEKVLMFVNKPLRFAPPIT
jgi:hypothetical protein